MSVSGTTNSNKPENVVSLFGLPLEERRDPLRQLLKEAEADAFSEKSKMLTPISKPRTLVTEDLYPDHSMYVLDQQIEQLRESIKRIQYYLGDLEDLLPY